MPTLNQVLVGNAYQVNNPAIIQNVWGGHGGWFSVTSNSAFVQLQYSKQNEQGDPDWTEEILVGAGAFATLPPNCIGVQFRNAIAGSIAIVTAQIATGNEPALAISALGNVQANLALQQIPRVTSLPASPTDQQVVSYLIPGFANSIEWLCIWNAATSFWDVLGGPPIEASYEPDEAIISTTPVVLPSASTALIMPNNGDYEVGISGAAVVSINGAQGHLQPYNRSIAAVIGQNLGASDSSNRTSVYRSQKITGMNAGQSIWIAAFVTSGQINVQAKTLQISPIRIQ